MSDTVVVVLNMPRAELAGLAQFVKRVDYASCTRFASRVTYDGRAEGDVIWSAICMLQRQLAEAGFAPR
jgi:hypothetical protein